MPTRKITSAPFRCAKPPEPQALPASASAVPALVVIHLLFRDANRLRRRKHPLYIRIAVDLYAEVNEP